MQVLSGSAKADGPKPPGAAEAASKDVSSSPLRQAQGKTSTGAAVSPKQGTPAAGAGKDEQGGSCEPETEDQKLFRKIVTTLKERGFFAGLTEGSKEWVEREGKARAKFNLRYNESTAAKFTNPGSPDNGRAEQDLRQRLALETKRMEDAEAAKSKGNAFLSAKKYADAVSAYTEAVRIWPNAVYYSNRAAAYTHMHMYDDAIADCRKAIELKPDFSKAYSRLGTAHFQAGRYRLALDEGYRKALELEPNNKQYQEALSLATTRLAAAESGGQDGLAGLMGDAGHGGIAMRDMEAMLRNLDPAALPGVTQEMQGMMGAPGSFDGAIMEDLIRSAGLPEGCW